MAIIECADSLAESLVSLGMVDKAQVKPGTNATVCAAPPLPQVPDDSWYTAPKWLKRATFALVDQRMRGVCARGPRGSGKTEGFRRIHLAVGRTPVIAQAYKGYGAENMIGGQGLANGSTYQQDGPLPLALMANGGRGTTFQIEESNWITDGGLSVLNTLTDGSGTPLIMPDGRTIPVGPDFRLVMCWNPGHAYGGNGGNKALMDRLCAIHCGYPPPKVEENALMKRFGVDRVMAEKLVSYAVNARGMANVTGFDLSLRTLGHWATYRMQGLAASWAEAFEWAVLDLAGSPDEEPEVRNKLAGLAANMGVAAW